MFDLAAIQRHDVVAVDLHVVPVLGLSQGTELAGAGNAPEKAEALLLEAGMGVSLPMPGAEFDSPVLLLTTHDRDDFATQGWAA